MAQNYDPTKPESGVTRFAQLYGIMQDHFAAIVSMFSGTSFPSNPVAGQPCYRTDLGIMYKYNGSSWEEWGVGSAIATEVINARGTAASIDARLDVGINPDGTFKGTAPASSWWTDEGDAVAFATSSAFTVAGDKTAIYMARRSVRLDLSGEYAYSIVSSSSYADPSTTVTIEDAVATANLQEVSYGQPRYNSALPESADFSGEGIVQLAPKSQIEQSISGEHVVTTEALAGFVNMARQWGKSQNFIPEILASSGNAVAWNLETAQDAKLTMTENTTIGKPSNQKDGLHASLRITHDGSSTVSWNACFKFAGGSAPTLSSSGVDLLTFRSDGDNMECTGYQLAVA